MDILIRTIKHEEQRYPTVGDWLFADDGSVLTIYVSGMGDTKAEFLVAIHEAIEAMLCRERGISEERVTDFDRTYELRRAHGAIAYQGEPGDHPCAPYRKEHFTATTIERLLAAELNVDWENYDAKVSAL